MSRVVGQLTLTAPKRGKVGTAALVCTWYLIVGLHSRTSQQRFTTRHHVSLRPTGGVYHSLHIYVFTYELRMYYSSSLARIHQYME